MWSWIWSWNLVRMSWKSLEVFAAGTSSSGLQRQLWKSCPKLFSSLSNCSAEIDRHSIHRRLNVLAPCLCGLWMQCVKASTMLQLLAGVSSYDVCDQTCTPSSREAQLGTAWYHLVIHIDAESSYITARQQIRCSCYIQARYLLLLLLPPLPYHPSKLTSAADTCTRLCCSESHMISYDMHTVLQKKKENLHLSRMKINWRPPASRVIREAENSWNANSGTIPMHAWPFSEARFRSDSRMTQWEKNNSNTSTYIQRLEIKPCCQKWSF